MIISPRAKEVTNMVRTEGIGFRKVNEVLLLRRSSEESPYRKITQWKRGIDSSERPAPPKLTSVAIVPEMTAAMSKGCAVYPSTTTAWQAFNRNATNAGAFGANEWATVAFPVARTIRGWALQFNSSVSAFSMDIEGLCNGTTWATIFNLPQTTNNAVSNGRYGGVTAPMECTAVRIRTNSAAAVRSCQFFECQPLVPVTMTSNTLPSTAGVTLAPLEVANTNLYQCFRNQSIAYVHGTTTATWYKENGSNSGKPSSEDQSRFEVRFTAPKTVCGFSVGGLASYTASYCYANCLLIEGRESEDDYWRRIDEVEFVPSEQRTRYFDFLEDHMVGQLRITVQDVTSGTSSAVYLPPMQVYGT